MPLVRPSREGSPSWIRFSLTFGRTRLKNTSLPRLIAGAALSAAFAFLPVASLRAQVAQQSYLRNTASDADREDPRIQAVIARAESHFKLGELNLKDGKREQARDEFDKAVDAVLESGLDVRAYPRLQQFYLQLVERVYRVEVPAQEQQRRTVVAEAPGVAVSDGAQQQQAAQVVQIGFVDQKFEPSPLDELSRLVLTEKEKEVSAGQRPGPELRVALEDPQRDRSQQRARAGRHRQVGEPLQAR